MTDTNNGNLIVWYDSAGIRKAGIFPQEIYHREIFPIFVKYLRPLSCKEIDEYMINFPKRVDYITEEM